jgi:hypothetical protein
MNKWIFFVAGIVVGVILTGFFNLLKLSSESTEGNGSNNTEMESKKDNGITFFEEPGDVVKGGSFKVFQVISKDAALVRCEPNYSNVYTGIVCLIVNRERKYYYDDEIVKVPKGKVVRQVGIYQYPTQNDMMKTVPIIMIMDK